MSTTMQRARRALLAGALALVTVPIIAASAAEAEECAAPAPCVTLKIVGAKGEQTHTIVVPLDASMEADNKNYMVRKPNEQATPLAAANAWSIKKVIASHPELDVKFSETDNPGKFPSVLDKSEIGGSGFDGSLVPGIYTTDTGEIGYIRPLRNPQDVNADDVFTVPAGTPLTLTLHTSGDLLDVKITSEPSKITTATPVTFSATVSPNSDHLSYAWNFTGGMNAEDKSASPSHTYTKKGTYSVNLQVRDDDGSYGRAATTSVKVGSPPKSKPTTGTGGTGGTGGGGGGGSGGTGGGGGGGGYVPPYIPNDTSAPPLGDAPLSDLPDLPTAPTDDGLQEVEGFVLAGAGAETGDSIPGVEVASQPTKASELSTSRKISGAVIGALAIILLLGIGAEIEARWVSTKLGHLRRRT